MADTDTTKNKALAKNKALGTMTRRTLLTGTSAALGAAALMSAVQAAFPTGAFAQGAGPEVKGTKLGYIALTDAGNPTVGGKPCFFTPPMVFVRFTNVFRLRARPFIVLCPILYIIYIFYCFAYIFYCFAYNFIA